MGHRINLSLNLLFRVSLGCENTLFLFNLKITLSLGKNLIFDILDKKGESYEESYQRIVGRIQK